MMHIPFRKSAPTLAQVRAAGECGMFEKRVPFNVTWKEYSACGMVCHKVHVVAFVT